MKEKWRPLYNGRYCFRDDCGNVTVDKWYDCFADFWRYENIPLFKTKLECAKYCNFEDELKNKSYKFSKEDWENKNINKYCIQYHIDNNIFSITKIEAIEFAGTICFRTIEDAQYIINKFKKELIEWLL